MSNSQEKLNVNDFKVDFTQSENSPHFQKIIKITITCPKCKNFSFAFPPALDENISSYPNKCCSCGYEFYHNDNKENFFKIFNAIKSFNESIDNIENCLRDFNS